VKLGVPTVLFESFWLNDSTVISTGIHRDGRFALFSSDGRRQHSIGDLPSDPRRKDAPVEVRQHAYQGTMTLAPDRGRFALATRHADQLEIYRSDGTLLRRVHGSRGFEPRYEVRRLKGVPYMTSGEDMRFGYIDVASTATHIYALYSGRARKEAPGEAHYGQHVQVFDWNGRLVGTYKLDASAVAIAPDPANGQLFAISRRPANALVRYALPPPFQSGSAGKQNGV
jgi:hypothetical protein